MKGSVLGRGAGPVINREAASSVDRRGAQISIAVGLVAVSHVVNSVPFVVVGRLACNRLTWVSLIHERSHAEGIELRESGVVVARDAVYSNTIVWSLSYELSVLWEWIILVDHSVAAVRVA